MCLPPMSLGAAHCAPVCIRIVGLGIPYGICLAGVPTEVNGLSNFQRIGMFVRMNLMV